MHPRQSFLRLGVVGITCIFASCSTGWNHDYESASPSLRKRVTVPTQVHVVTRDARRPFSGAEPHKTHVGTVEAPFGDPWYVRTQSGKALAREFAEATCSSLTQSGIRCKTSVARSPMSERTKELQQFAAKNPDKKLLHLTIHKWHVAVFATTQITYDLELEVLSNDLTPLAGVAISGKETPERKAFFNPAENASIVSPPFFSRMLKKLLLSPKIKSSLMLR